MDIYTIVMTVAIPFIVMGLKALSLPSKWAPVAAFVVAISLVAAGKALGIDLDVNTIADLIIKGLATSGVAVLGYDALKKITDK